MDTEYLDDNLAIMVKITNRTVIPYLNIMGPIVEPLPLQLWKVKNLQKMGYDVITVGSVPASQTYGGYDTQEKESFEYVPEPYVEPVYDNYEDDTVTYVDTNLVDDIPVDDTVVAEYPEVPTEEPTVVEEETTNAEEVVEDGKDTVIDEEYRHMTVKQLIHLLQEDDSVPEEVKAELGKTIKLKEDLLNVVKEYIL